MACFLRLRLVSLSKGGCLLALHWGLWQGLRSGTPYKGNRRSRRTTLMLCMLLALFVGHYLLGFILCVFMSLRLLLVLEGMMFCAVVVGVLALLQLALQVQLMLLVLLLQCLLRLETCLLLDHLHLLLLLLMLLLHVLLLCVLLHLALLLLLLQVRVIEILPEILPALETVEAPIVQVPVA